MTDASGQQISLDANVLEGNSESFQITYQTEDGQTVTTLASTTGTEGGDIVSKAFTTVAEGADASVEYITMTPEEAAAAGVVTAAEEEQVVTTSLQFDPANPSVLYTADGTPINQADLTPEEQALVQAALQQHLAEQEAEQQLQMMQETDSTQAQGTESQQQVADGNIVTSTSATEKQPQALITPQPIMLATPSESATTETTVTSTGNPVVFQTAVSDASSIDLASPDTSASQIVQTLANNVRKQQLEEKLKMTMQKSEAPKIDSSDVKYSEKIVIRQGQPEVVKVPVKKQPEIPAALANLMPKVEIGKDGSQVIRIHQSQITPGQLRALQDNPNVRLVFRPASATKAKSGSSISTGVPKKRGRPRKVPGEVVEKEEEPENEDPPAKTRCGRVTKRSAYMKDYLTPKGTKEMEEDDILEARDDDSFLPNSATSVGRPRGRPPGSGKNFKPRSSYASKIEALQNKDVADSLPVQMKPALTPIEQALSTRRKNRLREMLSACSEDEIMEVAMPHLARVFSLWEFLVTKVEKNKMSRVFFADIYKEYECLHKYVSKLAEQYIKAVEEKGTSEAAESTPTEPPKEEADDDKKDGAKDESEDTKDKKETSKVVQVTFTKLAESLGLQGDTLQEAEISLLDPVEAIGPRIMGMIASTARRAQSNKNIEDKNAKKQGMTPTEVRTEAKARNQNEGARPIQTEATSTISSSATSTQNASMPALKPLGQAQTTVTSQTEAAVNGTVEGVAQAQSSEAPMEVDGAAAQAATETATTEATSGTGTQLIQIGQGEDQQFIEVPEGYTLIQTPEGLVMSQPGTTISQGEDGTIYITHADGTTTPLNTATQQGVPMETVESLLSLDGQQAQT